MNLTPIKEVAADIKSIKIQGATNIAKAGIGMLAKELKRQKFKDMKELDTFIKQALVLLKTARDTEPMLFNGLRDCFSAYKALIAKKCDLKAMQEALYKECKSYLQDIETEEALRPLV